MSSTGSIASNTNTLIIQDVYAVDNKNIPIEPGKVLITTESGKMNYVDFNDASQWYLTPAQGPVTMNGHNIINSGQISIGQSTTNAALDINTGYLKTVYTTGNTDASGRAIFTIPMGSTTMYFEMIGSGGTNGIQTSGARGTGGYIQGTINVTAFQGQNVTIQVGKRNGLASSSASFISFISGGPAFVIAGSGGNGDSGNGVNGGSGGGGLANFVGGVANGSNGNAVVSIAGVGGSTVGGAGGGGVTTNGSNPSGFTDVTGGAGGTGTRVNGGAGGSGYAGGGGGGGDNNLYPVGSGGGGGSSYINTTYVTLISSYNGDILPSNILSGYGRINQDGYVAIYFETESSIHTAGDIVCDNTVTTDNLVITNSFTPTALSGGITGQITWDSGYIYVCTAGATSSATWKKAVLGPL